MSAKIPVSSFPELMAIWDWEFNTLSPDNIGKRSDEKVWWICPYGHEHYLQSPHQKFSKNSGCPQCSIQNRNRLRNEKIIEKKGSLYHTHPAIASEWDYEKNSISPTNILSGSHTKCWWKCSKCNQSYLMSPNMRTSKNRSCPSCGVVLRGQSKRINLIKKYGTLEESHPIIAREWDYEKNCDTPKSVHSGMSESRWWICEYGHPSYQQSIRDRVRRGSGCPQCNGELQTSFPEQALFYYLKKVFPNAQNRYNDCGFEIDIFIPEIMIGFEYDGSFWHDGKENREKQKDMFFNQKGIKIIHIKETNELKKDDSEFIIYTKATSDYTHLNIVIKKIERILCKTLGDINIKRDMQIIWEAYLSSKFDKSLQSKYPQIAADWDYNKNYITPDKVTPHSRKKVFWNCPICGNNYEMVIGDRTGDKKCSCPKCGIKKKNESLAKIKNNNKRNILEYRLKYPQKTISECSREIGLSYPTVKKYWNIVFDE